MAIGALAGIAGSLLGGGGGGGGGGMSNMLPSSALNPLDTIFGLVTGIVQAVQAGEMMQRMNADLKPWRDMLQTQQETLSQIQYRERTGLPAEQVAAMKMAANRTKALTQEQLRGSSYSPGERMLLQNAANIQASQQDTNIAETQAVARQGLQELEWQQKNAVDIAAKGVADEKNARETIARQMGTNATKTILGAAKTFLPPSGGSADALNGLFQPPAGGSKTSAPVVMGGPTTFPGPQKWTGSMAGPIDFSQYANNQGMGFSGGQEAPQGQIGSLNGMFGQQQPPQTPLQISLGQGSNGFNVGWGGQQISFKMGGVTPKANKGKDATKGAMTTPDAPEIEAVVDDDGEESPALLHPGELIFPKDTTDSMKKLMAKAAKEKNPVRRKAIMLEYAQIAYDKQTEIEKRPVVA